ncbi:hypothetical protein [uncultured Maritalea sp.]|uniref:hypothetical protein n=1 Tax=uncultured Maritalea sp. TaxID=757249 RepID=UPI0026098E47|nr:hypothetical protein [uncultured Maritalea sp.]
MATKSSNTGFKLGLKSGLRMGQTAAAVYPKVAKWLWQRRQPEAKEVRELFEQLGATTLVHGRLAGSGEQLVASMPGHVAQEPGSIMKFGANADALHMFDAASGKRLEQ